MKRYTSFKTERLDAGSKPMAKRLPAWMFSWSVRLRYCTALITSRASRSCSEREAGEMAETGLTSSVYWLQFMMDLCFEVPGRR